MTHLIIVWAGVAAMMTVPVIMATASPYLAYRNTAYIFGGFAGIFGLAFFFIQPLLAAGFLPGPGVLKQRRWHRFVGTAIVACVLLHLAGLYLTSAADTLDALLLVAPTPFSVYGVIALWGILLTTLLVMFRRRWGLRYSAWRLVHNGLALVVVVATVIHALLIQGAMEGFTKWILCLAALASTAGTLLVYWGKPLFSRKTAGHSTDDS
ncbi:ferric reductase-like transmembrane domain-containing protein [Roseibium aggregatum]|uniref:Ferric reductase n=1 Tax=Roseibium aggregatum TaxID=187304 RepID=A0A939EE34_9HYPH|nr:ferric reductase-like transmembrane domain-containing protein [Roseibium aggregatum]MBN9670852.1 ferric reductase [Roseibium aggregatum]